MSKRKKDNKKYRRHLMMPRWLDNRLDEIAENNNVDYQRLVTTFLEHANENELPLGKSSNLYSDLVDRDVSIPSFLNSQIVRRARMYDKSPNDALILLLESASGHGEYFEDSHMKTKLKSTFFDENLE